MATFHTSYTVTRDVTVNANGTVFIKETGAGGVDIIINGETALTLTSTGYLRRHPVTNAVNFRRLDNGKIAMKADDDTAI